ncbi:hypothetical protein QMA02_14510 [Bacillus wiedmannii]|uniref:hypothetical protein n=1 Tax=Bacillus wiedmannii TaxID=1890302 RepID=UPI0024AE4E3F|nr:hypothetical protein [Bacillus wiedmannii]MDI6677055.1 hypothetical protein [Bacillus wiedmannii]
MNRLITVVTKSIGSIRKAIVNYMSQPKEVQAVASSVTASGTDEDKKIPGSISWFTDHQKEEPDKLHRFYKSGTLKEEDKDGSYSINHKLSYKKKKTQQRNWSKWKNRNH